MPKDLAILTFSANHNKSDIVERHTKRKLEFKKAKYTFREEGVETDWTSAFFLLAVLKSNLSQPLLLERYTLLFKTQVSF